MKRGMRLPLYGCKLTIAEFDPIPPFKESLIAKGAEVRTTIVTNPPYDYIIDSHTILNPERLMFLPTADVLTTPFPDMRSDFWRNMGYPAILPKCILAWSQDIPKNTARWHKFIDPLGYMTIESYLSEDEFGESMWYSISAMRRYKGHRFLGMNEEPQGLDSCVDSIIYGLIDSGILCAETTD